MRQKLDAILNSWIDADENKKDQPSEDTLEQEEDTSSENGDDEDQTEEEEKRNVQG